MIARPDYPKAGQLGYYLIGKGVNTFAREAGAKRTFCRKHKNIFRKILYCYMPAAQFFWQLLWPVR